MKSPREIVLCQYHYDPLDRLIGHALPDVPERKRFYCKSRLATEIQGAMRYSIVQHGDQLLAQQRGEGDELNATLLATDQQRSVLQTLNADHPRQPIAYSPYGHRPVENGLLSLLGFNGERPFPVTGCYLLGNGYRAFNPVLMRFNSPDSWSPFGKGGLNAYAYCAGDSVNHRDRTGHGIEKIATVFANVPVHKIPRPTIIKPDNYYLAGFHGTSSSQIKNLKNGLDMKFAGKSNGQSLGPGFYATTDSETAEIYARAAVGKEEDVFFETLYPHSYESNPVLRNTPIKKTNTSPTVFAVYVKNYPDKIAGVNFKFKAGYMSPMLKNELVFPPDMYRDISLTPLTFFGNPPRPYTANLDIRDWTPPR